MNNFNYVSFLWNIAESLRGTYKAEDYGKVMLPLIVLRRFDCILDAHDREQIKEIIPLKDNVEEYSKREVLPHVADAYIDESTLEKIGYEIPFTRHFYKYEKLRGFEEIMAEISILETEIQEGIKKVLN